MVNVTIDDITAINLQDDVFNGKSDFMPPKERIINIPVNGWQESTYYIVEASFSINNPVHRYIFFSGFIDEKSNSPSGYNEFFRTQGLTISDAWYINPLFIIAKDHVLIGAIPAKTK